MAPVGRPSKRNGLVGLIDKALRFAASRTGDERWLLSSAEKEDLSEAMNEFARYHNIPVISPVWASRIGLLTSVGAIVASRADMIAGTAPAASTPAMPAATNVTPPAPVTTEDWLGDHVTH